ncbi:regulator of microtubule dynamics protein 1 isoform X2 [Crotalus tigris]|uniref:regulator of microtubule dynamics protein 1 isoform X2 n=1 Tax=Crotalus tigris TaxID=88082 RepID=UPI00192F2388|nr:regulator of microtubule dynamics protein 1 isoform X2 [Crotalus tigris]
MALGRTAVRRWLRSCCFWETRFFCEATRMKSGCSRQLSLSHGGKRGVEVFENSRIFRRGFLFSALSYLGYNTYLVISQSAMVWADVKVDEILDQADYLYGSGETQKLYQLLSEHKNSENAQVLWRLARALRDLAHLSQTSAENKKQLAYEALDYAKKALEKDNTCYSVHKWYAICLSDVGDYEGIKNKIASAFVIKEHFQKAIDLNPKDATSLHLMGIWCYTFADMPWYQRNIATVLFSTPPSSTYEEYFLENTSYIAVIEEF